MREYRFDTCPGWMVISNDSDERRPSCESRGVPPDTDAQFKELQNELKEILVNIYAYDQSRPVMAQMTDQAQADRLIALSVEHAI